MAFDFGSLFGAAGTIAGGILGSDSGPKPSKWYRNNVKNLYGDASNIADDPYTPYGGDRVAGFSPDETAGFDLIRGGIGSWSPDLDAAAGGLGSAAAYQPGTVASFYTAPGSFGGNYASPTSFGNAYTAPSAFGGDFNYRPNQLTSKYSAPTSMGNNYNAPASMGQDFNYRPTDVTSTYQAPTSMGGAFNYTPMSVGAPTIEEERIKEKNFTDFNINQYMNPFIGNVVDTSLADIERQRLRTENAQKGDMMRAGAWGGSRSGVAQALTNEGFGNTAASTASQLRMAGYESAADKIMQDANRNLTASQSNQSANLQAKMTSAQLAVQAGIANQMAGLDAAKFGASYGLDRDVALDSSRRFGADLNYRIGEGNANRGLDAAKFGAGYSLDRDVATDRSNQFGATYSLDRDRFLDDSRRFESDSAYRADKDNEFLGLDTAKFGATYGLDRDIARDRANQFGAGYSLDRDLARDDSARFGADYGLRRDIATDNSRRYANDAGMDAAKFNVGAGIDANNSRISANLGLGDIANMRSRLSNTDASNLMDIGSRERMLRQAGMDIGYENYLDERSWGRDNMSWLSSFLRDPRGVASGGGYNNLLGGVGGALTGGNLARNIWDSFGGLLSRRSPYSSYDIVEEGDKG